VEETVLEPNFVPSYLLHMVSKCHILWCVGTSFQAPTRKYENITSLVIITRHKSKKWWFGGYPPYHVAIESEGESNEWYESNESIN